VADLVGVENFFLPSIPIFALTPPPNFIPPPVPTIPTGFAGTFGASVVASFLSSVSAAGFFAGADFLAAAGFFTAGSFFFAGSAGFLTAAGFGVTAAGSFFFGSGF